MMKKLLAFGPMLALACLAACGIDEEGSAPTTSSNPTTPASSTVDPTVEVGGSVTPMSAPATTIAEACDAWASVTCARTAACAPGLYPALYENDAACRTVESRRCSVDAATLGVSLTLASVNACTADLAVTSCEDFVADRSPASCRPAGTFADGTSCETALQCASGFCAGAKDGTCGVCAPAVAAGAACVAGTCPSGLTCTKNVCVASKKIGDACKATTECGVGQVCEDGQACAPGRGSGELCALDADCNFLGGFVCSFATNRCTKVTVAAVGQSCGSTALCGAAGDCSNAGVCVTRPKEGEPCTGGATRCAAGLACIAGTCAFVDANVCK